MKSEIYIFFGVDGKKKRNKNKNYINYYKSKETVNLTGLVCWKLKHVRVYGLILSDRCTDC